MQTQSKNLRTYRTKAGREPFTEWLDGLRDGRGRAVIRVRLNRVAQGNFGNAKSVGAGVFELKIDFGPGYRVYYGLDGEDLVILLAGGDKSTQTADIKDAQGYWSNYNAEKD